MIPALLIFIGTSFIISKVGNIGKDAYILVGASIVQYACYFYIIRTVFSQKRNSYLLITLAALISFSIFIYAPPKLSNDVYRYFWDGLMQKSGYNPYDYVPGDWKLHDLQEANMPLYQHVDWRDKFTPYPPLAQYIFRISHTWYSNLGLTGGKFIFALPFLLSSLFIYFFLDKKIFAAFILNPLLLLETVANAHLDGWVILFIITALYLWKKEQYVFSSIVWTLAIATKVYPIIVIPYLFVDLLRKRKFTSIFLCVAVNAGILYFLYIPFIRESFFAITRYVTLPTEQEYNASIYRYMYLLLGVNKPGVTLLASKISVSFFFIIGTVLLRKRYSYELLLLVSIVYLLSSPIVFPWYTVFLISFIVLQVWESKNPRILYFFAFMQLIVTIIYLEPGKWILRETMLNIEYFLLLLSLVVYKRRMKVQFPFSAFSRKQSAYSSKQI